jgi:hypothetical protein
MAGKSVLADLVLRLSANSAALEKGLKQAGKATSDLGKEMKGIFGDAAKAVDSMIPGFSGLTGGISKAIGAVKGMSGAMNVLKVAIASTGIGLLVIALGSLISYFKNTEKGGDALAKVLGGIRAVISTVLTKINALGEAIVLLFKGDFKGAAEKAKEAVTGWGEAIKTAYNKGADAAERLDALEEKRAAFILEEQDLINKIAKAREDAANTELSAAKRQQANTDQIKLTNELYDKRQSLQQEEYDILKLQNSTKEQTTELLTKENEALRAVRQLDAERSNELATLYKKRKSITEEAKKELEYSQQIADSIAALTGLNLIEVDIIPKIKTDLKLPGIQETTLKAPVVTEEAITGATLWQNAWTDAATAVQMVLSNTGIASQEIFLALRDSAVGAVQQISGALMQGGEDFKEFGKNIANVARQAIGALIAEGVATLIMAAFKTAAKTGPLALIVAPALAALGAGIAKTAFNSLVPSFASGGIAYGPTYGMMGEYPGARQNPEIIAPLDKLKDVLSPMPQMGEVRFVIEQDQLVGILSNYNNKNIYF